MTDRSSVWIGMVDMCLAVLAVVIVAVNPPHKAEAAPNDAQLLVTAEWSVDVDADVDLHMMLPNNKPVYYAARQYGCVTLDTDNHGFTDSQVTLADGTVSKLKVSKETIAIKCIEPGHYDSAVNLFTFDGHGQSFDATGFHVKVHLEVNSLVPKYHLVYQKDIELNHIKETQNWVSFDMARDGTIKLADPPLTPITEKYQSPIDRGELP